MLAPGDANSLTGKLDPAATGKVTAVLSLSVGGKPTEARIASSSNPEKERSHDQLTHDRRRRPPCLNGIPCAGPAARTGCRDAYAARAHYAGHVDAGDADGGPGRRCQPIH